MEHFSTHMGNSKKTSPLSNKHHLHNGGKVKLKNLIQFVHFQRILPKRSTLPMIQIVFIFKAFFPSHFLPEDCMNFGDD